MNLFASLLNLYLGRAWINLMLGKLNPGRNPVLPDG